MISSHTAAPSQDAAPSLTLVQARLRLPHTHSRRNQLIQHNQLSQLSRSILARPTHLELRCPLPLMLDSSRCCPEPCKLELKMLR